MIMKPAQPSAGCPTNPCCPLSAHGVTPGQSLTASSTSELEARYVWIPYHATAINPRMMAGTLAPSTPKGMRAATGYGVSVAWLGLATRLHRKYTMTMPTSSA